MPSEYFMPDPRFSIDGLYPSIGLGKTYGEIRKTFTNLREQLHSNMSTNISCFQRTTRQKGL